LPFLFREKEKPSTSRFTVLEERGILWGKEEEGEEEEEDLEAPALPLQEEGEAFDLLVDDETASSWMRE
jgi:hypothetical protein